MNKQLSIDVTMLNKGAAVLRALKHDLRQKIIKLVHQKKRITVTEIYVALRIPQPVASQQLAILRRGDFVIAEKQGKHIFYSINYERFHSVGKSIDKLLDEDN